MERKLFPHKKPQQNVPSIEEILPIVASTSKVKKNIQSHEPNEPQEEEEEELSSSAEQEPESLQSVESEHYDSFYQDKLQEAESKGKFKHFLQFLSLGEAF